MEAYRVGQTHRLLRHRLRRTQEAVAKASGVGRNKISELENNDLSRITVPELDRCFAAMGATMRIKVYWRGAGLDRLFDEGHAAMSAAVGRLLRRHGWTVEFEVTFARDLERGSIDALAWHAPSRTLVVIEVKTELGSIEGTLRPIDAKARLASAISAERFGWQPLTVGRVLVLPEDRGVRRDVERHAGVLNVALPARTIAVKQWLANPHGPISGILFLATSQLVGVTRNPSAIRRVRTLRNRPTAA